MGPDSFGVERQPAVSPYEVGRIAPGFVATSNPNEYFNEEQPIPATHKRKVGTAFSSGAPTWIVNTPS